MTNEEAAAILESEAEYLYSQDEPYSRQAFNMAIEALQERTTAQDVAETPEFHEGELIVYQNGETFQIGEIKRLCEFAEGAFVYYHEGDTACLTPFENMHKLQNAYCIKQTSFAEDRPRCGNCEYFCMCTSAKEPIDDASECNKYTKDKKRCETCLHSDDDCEHCEFATCPKMEEENMKDEDLKKLEAQIAQLTNALSDMVQKMHEHFTPLYDAVEKATALIEAQIADKPSCENCLYHDTEAGTDICKYWDEVPPAYTPCCKHKFKKPKEG